MADAPQPPAEPRHRPSGEYEDRHYHDDEDVPADDGAARGPRLPARREPAWRVPSPGGAFPKLNLFCRR